MAPNKKRQIGTLALMTSVFLNPMGFDAAFYMVMELTGSYGITTAIFYLASALFFTLSCILLKLNPITLTRDFFKRIFTFKKRNK